MALIHFVWMLVALVLQILGREFTIVDGVYPFSIIVYFWLPIYAREIWQNKSKNLKIGKHTQLSVVAVLLSSILYPITFHWW